MRSLPHRQYLHRQRARERRLVAGVVAGFLAAAVLVVLIAGGW